MQTVPVVFSSDHNFVMPTGVAIKSMLQYSANCKCEIYIIKSNDFTASDEHILRDLIAPYNATISFVSAGDTFAKCFEIRSISTATYYRLYIPWLIPEHEKIIYCDGDVIFKQSILNIFNFDLDDNYIAGVRTGGSISKAEMRSYIKTLNLNPDNYINGGVQLINSKLMRESKLNEEFEKHLRKKYTYQDQDIVNIVCKDRIAFMPKWFNAGPMWTAFLPEVTNQESLQNYNGIYDRCGMYPSELNTDLSYPVIIHYAGEKPWKHFTYLWLSWWNVYKETVFFDPSLELRIEHNTLKKSRLSFSTYLKSYISDKFPKAKKFILRLKK